MLTVVGISGSWSQELSLIAKESKQGVTIIVDSYYYSPVWGKLMSARALSVHAHPGILLAQSFAKPNVAAAQVGVNSIILDLNYKFPLSYLYKSRYYNINETDGPKTICYLEYKFSSILENKCYFTSKFSGEDKLDCDRF